jgi:hypothetical protein
MITSKREEDDFLMTLRIGDRLPAKSVEYIAGHYNPEDIFSIEQLREWALAVGYRE